MKRIVALLPFFLLIVLFSCKQKPENLQLQKIEYDVLVNNYSNSYSWFDHIDGFQRNDMFALILKQARSGEFKLEDMTGNPILPDAIDSLLSLNLMMDSIDSTVIVNNELLNGLRFRESWTINPETGFIEKKIIAICPLYYSHHELMDEMPIEVYPFFWMYSDTTAAAGEPIVLAEKIAYDVFIDNTTPYIMYSYGEDLPFFFMNIETSMREKIINAIIESAFNEEYVSYDFFFLPMSEKEMSRIKESHDTVTVIDPNDINEYIDTVVTKKLDIANIVRLKFIERWTLDPVTMQFTKTVYAVNPSEISFNEFGEFRGFKPLFWLLFDESQKENFTFK